MKPLRIDFLGDFAARIGDRPPVLASARKAQALLAYLVLERGRPCPRQNLATLLWGRHGDMQARNSLRQTLHVIRTELPGFAGLRSDAKMVSLDTSLCQSDVLLLEDCARNPNADISDHLLRRFASPLLQGLGISEPAFEEWLDVTRRHHQSLAQTVLRREISRREMREDLEGAVDLVRLLLDLDPLQEDIHRTAMRLYLRGGRVGAALRQFHNCRATLRRELGIEPDAETIALLHASRNDPRAVQAQADVAQHPGIIRTGLPVIAVRPFAGNAELESHLRGDVTRLLASFRDLAVVSEGAMSGLSADPGDTVSLTTGVGATYAIEGAINFGNGNVQANMDLVDCATLQILWTGRFPCIRDDVVRGSDTLPLQIASQIRHAIDRAEWQRMQLLNSGKLEPWQWYQRGRMLVEAFDPVSSRKSREMFRTALELDPTFAPAFAWMAYSHFDDWVFFHIPGDSVQDGLRMTREALKVDPTCAMAHAMLSWGAHLTLDLKTATDAGMEAIRLNPGDPNNYSSAGNAFAYAGLMEKGISTLRAGLALNPYRVQHFPHILSRAYLTMGDIQKALTWSDMVLRYGEPRAYHFLMRASALARLKDWPAAEGAIETALSLEPGVIDWAMTESPTRFADPTDHDRILFGIHELGFA